MPEDWSASSVALIPRMMIMISLGVEDRSLSGFFVPLLLEIHWFICWLAVANGTSNRALARSVSSFEASGMEINSLICSLAKL